MAQKIIGRHKEQQKLQEIYNFGRPEFVVVQGRKRGSKTFLIREMFNDKATFCHTRLSPAEISDCRDYGRTVQVDFKAQI